MKNTFNRIIYIIITFIEASIILFSTATLINKLSDMLGLSYTGTGYDYTALKLLIISSILFILLKNLTFDHIKHNRLLTILYSVIVFILFAKIRYSPTYLIPFALLLGLLVAISLLLLSLERYFFQKES